LLDFEFSVQAALGLFNLSAVALIMFTVSKRISLSADSDQGLRPLETRKPFGKKA
jgi:hypothetical protein